VDFLKSITVQQQAEQEDERRDREKERIREAAMEDDDSDVEIWSTFQKRSSDEQPKRPSEKHTTEGYKSDPTQSSSSQNNGELKWRQRCSEGEAGLAAERSGQDDLLNELIKPPPRPLHSLFRILFG
jgi:hypothetical protein